MNVNIMISVPAEMVPYIVNQDDNVPSELEKNALLLYPYILAEKISHEKAAEILGISKFDLVDVYLNLGIPYMLD